MTSSDISQAVGAAITPSMVIERMIEMLNEPIVGFSATILTFDEPPSDPGIDRIKEHKRRADRSACGCPYCAAIKTYVGAKLLVRRLDRYAIDDYGPRAMTDMSGTSRMQAALRRLVDATRLKDQAKTLDISAYVGAE